MDKFDKPSPTPIFNEIDSTPMPPEFVLFSSSQNATLNTIHVIAKNTNNHE